MLAGGAASLAACATQETNQATEPDTLLVDLDRQPDFEIDLWPDGAPGAVNVSVPEEVVHRDNDFGLVDRALHNVTRPRLFVFRSQTPDGSAILITPGGGYKWVVIDKEGYEGARLFSRGGASVYVLMYRLPHQGWAAGPDTPLQDAQRAMRVIRARAGEDRIDPARVMVMGFSAGGHVAGSLTARFDTDVYSAVDEADQLSARPDASVLVYPVATMRKPFTHGSSSENMIGTDPSENLLDKYSLESTTRPDMPPIFLLHATDDLSVPVENSLNLYAALKGMGVPTAMHVFENGGHGYGLRGIDNTPLRLWPELVKRWGVSHGMFNA
jgi:acetyl esterase/lipase